MFVKHCKVEVYKNDFLLAENSNLGKTYKKKFSKADTLGESIDLQTYPELNRFSLCGQLQSTVISLTHVW